MDAKIILYNNDKISKNVTSFNIHAHNQVTVGLRKAEAVKPLPAFLNIFNLNINLGHSK